MPTLLLKKLVQKISNLEKELGKVRRSVSSRQNLNIPSDPSIQRVQLAEAVSDAFSIIKIVHNSSGENTYARGIVFGSGSADDDLPNFVPAIALSPGDVGDHILVKTDGASFALTLPSTDAYGADDQIKAGDKLKVDSTPGVLEKGNDNSTNYFIALESRHVSEEIIRVKFAIPEPNTSLTNRSFIVDVTSLFGGQTYFGQLYTVDPATGDLVVEEIDITVKVVDDGMVGVLTAGLKYIAWRSDNFGSDANPFYFYFIQPTRVE